MDTFSFPCARGCMEVEEIETIEFDRHRLSQQLYARAYFPKKAGCYPAIVWSHGLKFNKNLYRPLLEFWASHGYIVIIANHLDAVKGVVDHNYEVNRTDDIKCIFDNLDTIEDKYFKEFKVSVDRSNLGMGGHSLGAHTTQLIGGTINKDGARFMDPRPNAFLMVSPRGSGGKLDRTGWREFERPAMVITGTKDESLLNAQPYTWRTEGFRGMPANNKFLVLIDEACHGFGGITGIFGWNGSGPANDQQVEAVQTAGLLFWDCFLKNRSAELQFLRSGKIENISNRTVFVTYK